MDRLRTSRSRGQQGASAVEFALVLPLLVMLVFGVIEFGVVLAQKSSLSSAVRSGARYGSVNLVDAKTDPHTCGKVIQHAQGSASTISMQGSDIKVEVYRGADEAAALGGSPICTSGGAGSQAATPCTDPLATNNETLFVRASYPASVGIPLTGVDADFDLVSTGAYRCEYR